MAPALLLLLIILFAVLVFVAPVIRRIFAARRKVIPAAEARCKCGYTLTGLDRLRCPECGRVVGFDVTPDALGLTDEQLQRAAERRAARERPRE